MWSGCPVRFASQDVSFLKKEQQKTHTTFLRKLVTERSETDRPLHTHVDSHGGPQCTLLAPSPALRRVGYDRGHKQTATDSLHPHVNQRSTAASIAAAAAPSAMELLMGLLMAGTAAGATCGLVCLFDGSFASSAATQALLMRNAWARCIALIEELCHANASSNL